MRRLISLTLAGLAVPMALHAQKVAAKSAASIDPGMNRAQVVAALGEPYSTRNKGSFTYLMYRNGCEKSCGMSDLVVLDSDKVVDAVFRSGERHYSGTSSSPHMVSADEAEKIGGDSTKGTHTAKARMASTKANDAATPSKPANPPKLKIAPSPTAPAVKQTAAPVKPVKDTMAKAAKPSAAAKSAPATDAKAPAKTDAKAPASKPLVKTTPPSPPSPVKPDTATKKPEPKKPGD